MSDLIKTLKSSSTGDDVYPNIKEDNIPTGAVTSAKIGTSAVITGKINDGAVTTNKIADGSVNYDKLATALKNLIDGKASSSDLIIVQNALSSHTSNTSNPHSVTKSQVGLGNVDNTSDASKPISTATQTALDLKADKSTTYTKTEVDTALSGKQDTLTFDNAPTQDSTNPVKSGGVYTALSNKQDTLVSGTNIKTINNTSLLGSGDITISGGGQLYQHKIKMYFEFDDNGQTFTLAVYFDVILSTNVEINTKALFDTYIQSGRSYQAYVDYDEYGDALHKYLVYAFYKYANAFDIWFLDVQQMQPSYLESTDSTITNIEFNDTVIAL